MALPTEVTYSTIDDFQANTLVTAQKEIDEDDWTPFALEAETIIDEYIGFIQKYDEDQVRKFPTTDEDGNSYIPEDIQIAHIKLTSHLILQGEPTAETQAIQKESWSGTGYSKEYSQNSDGNIDSDNVGLPPLVLKILRKYGGYSAPITF